MDVGAAAEAMAGKVDLVVEGGKVVVVVVAMDQDLGGVLKTLKHGSNQASSIFM